MKIRIGFVSNSSSSSFICNGNGYNLAEIKDILVKIFELAKYIEDTKTDENYKHTRFTKKFSDMFEEPFIVGTTQDKYCNMIWERFKCYKEHDEYNDEHGFVDFDSNPFSQIGIKTKKDLIGKIVINSTKDNSIPYAFFELIEETFNGRRIHLG